MSIAYLFASLLGALTTLAVLWPDAWPVAILCAPLGGSAATLAVAVTVGLLRPGSDVSCASDMIPV
jgi:hypothetical protein